MNAFMVRCWARRCFGSFGLPMSKKISSPRKGSRKISSSQAMAEDGLRFTGMMKSITKALIQPAKPMKVVIVAQVIE